MNDTIVTYHCPNCAAGLAFNPDKGKLCCEYCLSEFTEQELAQTLSSMQAEEEASAAAERAAEESEVPNEEFCAQLNTYHCNACGAEILADDNTAADICPYCHNPVLLTGRLTGHMQPHKIIPFQIDKDEAKKRFLEFAGKKWFVPRDFLAEAQINKMQGIYYPFWVTDADVNASMSARATRVRTWYSGDYRYTETSKYHITRAGEIHFEDIVTPAITEEDKEMLDGILPYPSDSLQPFTMACLSGFVAKKRDIEKESVREAVRTRMQQYAASLLQGTIGAYTSITPSAPRLLTRTLHWDYTLMPIWLLTYQHRGKTYTYALNGYTGKVFGRLPVCPKRLSLLGVIAGLAAGVAAALIKLFLLS